MVKGILYIPESSRKVKNGLMENFKPKYKEFIKMDDKMYYVIYKFDKKQYHYGDLLLKERPELTNLENIFLHLTGRTLRD